MFQLKEEIAMRELIEQDAKEKQDSLRAEVDGMKYVLSQEIFILPCKLKDGLLFRKTYFWTA